MGSQGEVPVKASALTAGGAGGATLGTVFCGAVPLTETSAWASSRTTAPGPVARAETLEAPVGALMPLSRCRLTPSATALAELAPVCCEPSPTVMVDSSGVD